MFYESFENKFMELMINHIGLYVSDKHDGVSLDQMKTSVLPQKLAYVIVDV